MVNTVKQELHSFLEIPMGEKVKNIAMQNKLKKCPENDSGKEQTAKIPGVYTYRKTFPGRKRYDWQVNGQHRLWGNPAQSLQ